MITDTAKIRKEKENEKSETPNTKMMYTPESKKHFLGKF